MDGWLGWLGGFRVVVRGCVLLFGCVGLGISIWTGFVYGLDCFGLSRAG